jgi:hypothetical protein
MDTPDPIGFTPLEWRGWEKRRRDKMKWLEADVGGQVLHIIWLAVRRQH